MTVAIGQRERLLAGGLLVVLALAAHGPGIFAGFIIDDDAYVTGNETLGDLGGLRDIWFDLEASPQYYPLVFSTFWVEQRLWGNHPAGYHGTNIVLHVVNALCVWMLLQALAVPGAWLGAALFAVHPVQVESVAWVAERKNVLSTLFYLASALGFVRYRRSGEIGSGLAGRWYLLCLALFVLAMLSKTASVSLPVAVLLVIWWKEGRVGRRDVLQVGPMVVLGLSLSMITIWIETTRGGAAGALWDLSWLERFLLAGRAVWFYAGKLIWPLGLSFNYPRWSVDASDWWQYFYPLSLAVVLWMLWRQRERLGRGALTGVLFFIVTLGPTLGFVNIYFFRYSFVADHFQYLAALGLLAPAAAGLTSWRRDERKIHRWGALVPAILVSALAFLSWQRSWVFRDLETLCLDTRAKNPESWLAINNLGTLYLARGDLEAAVREFETARGIAPSYLETHLNLAIAYMNLERWEESIAAARRAIDLKPENKFAYHHAGEAYLRSGRAAAAIPWFELALARDPDYLRAKIGLGTALAQTGRTETAIHVLTEVVSLAPENSVARANLAIALAQAERFEEAVAELERAVQLDPENAILRENLALARQLAGERAVGPTD